MRTERSKNASRNMFFGFILKIYQIVVPFLMRTAMIYFMGVQYLGLNSLFVSVIHVLNLAELGVSSAMVYSMYKPIAEHDTTTICTLMKLYKTYYRVIGIVVLCLGLLLVPFIPHLINGTFPSDINIYVLYLMNLMATVLSYWLFAYKNSIIYAHQRADIFSKTHLFTDTVKYILQLSTLAIFHNYYLYVMAILLTQILTNIINAIIANKMYPEFIAKGSLPKEEVEKINQRIKDLFTVKVGGVVISSVDTLVISAFLGLKVLAIYQNYFYMITSINGMMRIIFHSCTAGIGNSLIIESKEKNYKDFKKFTFIISWISSFCTCCFLCLSQPFMKLWMGESLMLEFPIVVCLCIFFFVHQFNSLFNLYKDASGIWHADRYRLLITAIANLVMNLIMVQMIGLYGIVLSTVLSTLFIGIPWLLYNLFTTVFAYSEIKNYLFRIGGYCLIAFICCVSTYYVCLFVTFDSYLELICKLLICCVIPNVIYFVVYYRKEEFKDTLVLLNKMTGGKLSFVLAITSN
ncbi:MAG: polysaccharide biosynthesis protein [Erysipelotrichaceae bacterium]|nr:polysaccharide biosynthesis protein [Erysipelotrichaceae bacterium]